MHSLNTSSTLIVLVLALIGGCTTVDEIPAQKQGHDQLRVPTSSRQWAFNAPRADGYRIDLLDAEPRPGTPLVKGSTVAFKVRAKYSMTAAERGAVILVFQDPTRLVQGTSPQTRADVTGPNGTIELSRDVTIPDQTDLLQLSVPLQPEGLMTSDGEIVLHYPVVNGTAAP